MPHMCLHAGCCQVGPQARVCPCQEYARDRETVQREIAGTKTPGRTERKVSCFKTLNREKLYFRIFNRTSFLVFNKDSHMVTLQGAPQRMQPGTPIHRPGSIGLLEESHLASFDLRRARPHVDRGLQDRSESGAGGEEFSVPSLSSSTIPTPATCAFLCLPSWTQTDSGLFPPAPAFPLSRPAGLPACSASDFPPLPL